MGRKTGIGRIFKKTKPRMTEAEAEPSTSSASTARASTSSAWTRSKALAPKTKKKDSPINVTKAEDPHGKKPAGRKPPPATKAPSDEPTRSRRTKNKKVVKEPLPLLFQRMPQLMEIMNNPSMVESIVNHLSSWKPLETAAVKAPPDGGGKPSAAATTTIESAVTGSEGQIDENGGETTIAAAVGLEESTAVEAIAIDEASMEISSAEAPTTVDSFTQTEPVTVPRLVSRRMKIKTEDMIALDKLAFTFKKNMQIRAGQNIHGPNGSATRARQRCVKQLISHIKKMI